VNTTYGNTHHAPAGSGRLKDQPAGERPRERLIECGAQALSPAELVAILVRTGLRGTNALDIGKQLVCKFGSLGAMARASVDDLQTASRFASRTSSAIARTFTNRCASHCANTHRCCVRCFPPLPRHCVAAAQMLRRTLRVCCATC
jgi:DNA repair protein RadC